MVKLSWPPPVVSMSPHKIYRCVDVLTTAAHMHVLLVSLFMYVEIYLSTLSVLFVFIINLSDAVSFGRAHTETELLR